MDSAERAIAAEKGGAHRLEVCSHLEVEGLTPSFELLSSVLSAVSLPIHVMIRPRAGNFVLSEDEIHDMLLTINQMKKYPISGVVIGTLTSDNQIDTSQLQLLIEAARPLSITFHRAFDHIANKRDAVVTLIKLQVDRLLTSGCPTNAFEGRFYLRQLVDIVNSFPRYPLTTDIQDCYNRNDSRRRTTRTDRLVIVAAGGIRQWNVQEIVETSGVTEIHSSQIFSLPISWHNSK